MAGEKLDPKGKYLIQEVSGAIYPWNEKLAKRKDMKPYFHETGGKVLPGNEPRLAVKRVPIKLQDKEFMVEEDLRNTLAEVVGVVETVVQENAALKEEKAAFEAVKERLNTDIFDLTEQLKEANAKIAELSKPAEAEQPEKKGKSK
ncbi:MAG: hypothetical protein ABFD62_03505 [Syntrophaceae bacterium]